MGKTKEIFCEMKSFILIICLIGIACSQAVVKPKTKCHTISKNGRCGKSFKNTQCAIGFCSKWNWCGTSSLHKKTHQLEFDAKPACSAKAKPVKKAVVSKKTKKQTKKATKSKAKKAAKKAIKKTKKAAK